MIKIMIVDDEHFVRMGIKSTIEWEKNGYVIVGEADNGLEAVEKILYLSPDIVLLDITMPGLDGLEVLERVRAEGYLGHIIMLTAHEDFRLIQKSMREGANDYILKNEINGTKLLDYLKTIELNHLSESGFSSNTERNYYKVNFLNNIFKIGGFSKEEFLKGRERYSIGFNTEGMYMIFIHIKNLNKVLERYQESDSQILFNTVDNMIEESLRNCKEKEHYSPDSKNQLILLSFSYESSDKKIYDTICEIVNVLTYNFQMFLNVETIISVYRNSREVSEWDLSYNEASELLGQSFFYPLKKVFWYSEFHKEERFENLDIQLKRVVECNKIGNEYRLSQILTDAIEEKQKQMKVMYLNKLEKILHNAVSSLNKKFDLDWDFQMDKGTDIFHFISELEYYDDLVENAKQLNDHSHLISQALTIINQEFTSEIMLDDVAYKLSVNPSYFSRVFSKEMKVTFSAYLIEKRIEYAKKLIRDTNLKFYEIAEKCGFNSSVHFNNTFKKLCGITPNQFRNKRAK